MTQEKYYFCLYQLICVKEISPHSSSKQWHEHQGLEGCVAGLSDTEPSPQASVGTEEAGVLVL